VFILRATNKLLQRIGPPALRDGERSTTLLGDWYATVLFWKPQVALLVNEPTLLPVLMPLAPAATMLARIPGQIVAVLAAHGTAPAIIDGELERMREHRLAKTANRSVVGVMNEFTYLAEVHRGNTPGVELMDLTVRLAATPCGPLYRKNVSPDRELAAHLRAATG
jgi:hypothetical protein